MKRVLLMHNNGDLKPEVEFRKGLEDIVNWTWVV